MPDAPAPQPFDARELPITTRWPTIGSTRWAGSLAGSRAARSAWGFFTLGKLLALATIPLSLAVFAWQLMPLHRPPLPLTNRRIVVPEGAVGRRGPVAGARAVRCD